jgi:ubiquinone/menaquinone biosynthesis C-methylase UbiE
MGFHTFDAERAAVLEDESRFRFCSREELLSLVGANAGTRLLDVGSGTGFYTRELAPYVAETYALDLQPAMHAHHRDAGLAEEVHLLVGAADAVPLRADAVDAVVSTMTFHEFANDASLAELARVLRPGGRLVTVDWSLSGEQAAGPHPDERFALADAVRFAEDAGFAVDVARNRAETFVCVARLVP